MRSTAIQQTTKLSNPTLAGGLRRSMGHVEVSLKLLVGLIIGTELIGVPVLLLLGALWDFELVRSPLFSGIWILAAAILGAVLSVRFLPRFSRDRGRIADFLINPRHVGSSLGYFDSHGR